jgi:hypothetical protein
MKRRRFGARRVGRGGRRGGRTVPGAVHLADATASESAGLEASRARVPRACVARREVTARAIGAACHSLAKLPKVFARSVSDVRICRSHVMHVKISTCEWTSSAEKRKKRKRDATKPRECFPSSGTARKYPRGVRFSPGARILSSQKFLVFWEFSAVLGWNPKHRKSAFCTRQKSNRLVRFVKPREVVASIASCARPVSGYRARFPHRYVPARKRFPLARAVRRPSVDRRPTPAPGMTRFVAEDAFSFPATWSASTTNVSASPPRREAGAAAPAQSARARRVRACLATRPRRPRESDPLPAARRRALNHALVASKKQGVELPLFRARDVFGTAKVARLRLRVRRGIFFPRTEASVTYRFFARGTPWRSL